MGNTTHPVCIVRVELQRIQTFLFSVPRLRAMLGANALLGDMLRRVLPELAKDAFALPYDPVPEAAEPEGDPLADLGLDYAANLKQQDDPAACYENGILARDGGHLTVAFGDEDKARDFIRSAYARLAETLPDLPVSIRLIEWERKDEPDAGADQTPSTAQLAEIPQFQGCTESGIGVASTKDDNNDAYRSKVANDKLEAGAACQDGDFGKYRDLVSLLARRLPGYADSPKRPGDLEDLSDAGGYIALIHADGNRIGQRLKAYQTPYAGDLLKKEVQTEHFFHHMRVAARASVVTALRKVFKKDVLKRHERLPYQLLMIGGDDLLLLCQPQYALPFVVEYARALEQRPNLPDRRRLSIGAGIVIAKHSLPFHRLHALAEGLAASAKRAYLQRLPKQQAGPEHPEHPERSVADWMILSTSWGEDPETQRKRYDRVEYRLPDGATETLALTAKPYFVLTKDLAKPDTEVSLEQLTRTADDLCKLDEGDQDRPRLPLPRGQLKSLIGELSEGRRWAEMRFNEVRDRLQDDHLDALDDCVARNKRLWRSDPGSGRYLTHIRDLIELTELRFLGRRKQDFEREEAKHQTNAGTGTEEQIR